MSQIKVLIVEDEAIVAIDISRRLERMGYKVTDILVAGEDTLTLLSKLQAHNPDQLPDLVLMDIVLQGDVDGIETTRQIRATYNIPVVYLTANADENTLQRAKVTTPFGYVLKPFNERELRASIEIALSRHQAEQEVLCALEIAESRRESAEELSDRRSQMLSLASHEFRTPLSSIQASAQLLQNYGHQLSAEKRQQGFQRIQNAVASMNQLLEDVLTLSRTEAGQFMYNPVEMELLTVCKELLEPFQFTVGQNYRFTCLAPDGPVQAWLDEKLIRHLLNNLLSNAIKYSAPGSEVQIKVFARNDWVCLQVIDQGIGIPPDEQQRLFDPFFRASNVDTQPGTGLGLAIAKLAVDLHGGQITVSSTPNQGSRFTIWFPQPASSFSQQTYPPAG
jgi:signal transduction histidine kinase